MALYQMLANVHTEDVSKVFECSYNHKTATCNTVLLVIIIPEFFLSLKDTMMTGNH